MLLKPLHKIIGILQRQNYNIAGKHSLESFLIIQYAQWCWLDIIYIVALNNGFFSMKHTGLVASSFSELSPVKCECYL